MTLNTNNQNSSIESDSVSSVQSESADKTNSAKEHLLVSSTASGQIEDRLFRLLCESADHQPLETGIRRRLRLKLRKEGLAPSL